MFDKASLLYDCIKYPHYVEFLTAISVNSNYLADILVRNPEFFYRFVNPSNLNVKLDEKTFSKIVLDTISVYKSFQAKVNSLRSLKRREILRIGLKDILGISELTEVTSELSVLAKVISDKLFSICLQEIFKKYEMEEAAGEYCIISLGKLGGNELNYSSDIDLVIVYNEDLILKGKNYSEILTEAVYLFIESSTSLTGAGFIYRIDFRLRPDGRNSSLCKSFNEFISYYESRGEDWERQMLIKSSFLSGSKNFYDKLINYLNHFIYPSTFSVSPTEQIKMLKRNIERQLGKDENIKLLPGGIRDIEFSVQALQLINGGKNINIRTGNTLQGIAKLSEEKLLTNKEAETLKTAYIFYRRIEHFLQLMNDTQTHIIPEHGEILEKLSSFLRYENSLEFKGVVKSNRSKVQKIFNSIIGVESKVIKEKRKIKFENENKAYQNLKFLREGTGLLGQKSSDKKSIEAFRKIEPDLMKHLKYSISPDLVLQNFVRVIKEAKFPSIWYSAFVDKNFFKNFLTLLEFSQKSVDLFAEDKELREDLLSKKAFEKINSNSLKNFSTKKLTFILSVQLVLNKISYEKLSSTLCDYFKIKIVEIFDKSSNKDLKRTEFFIAALGSFSTKEITFASDIDLIFVVDKLDKKGNLQKEFQNILLTLKKEFNPYNVDCRLRPEGKSSQLVWEFDSYSNYLKERARTWELQAFTKLNFIHGNKKLFSLFKKSLIGRVKNEDEKNIKRDLVEMRNKLYPKTVSLDRYTFNLKKSRGGLSDIEFILQYLILCNAELYKKCIGNSVIRNINALTENNYKGLKKLKDNFAFLKKIELLNQNIFNNTLPNLVEDDKKFLIFAKKLGLKNKDEFFRKIKSVALNNQNLFDKYLG
jgi:glutamate-ammonia-ligase adenylyltransferase